MSHNEAKEQTQITPMWDVQQYSKFRDERARPFFDLLARVNSDAPGRVFDLGCGTGELTRIVAERWPQAQVTGVDNSPEMLTAARSAGMPSRLKFQQADIATWTPETAVELIVSNAALHWVDNHHALLERLSHALGPNGILAVQMPNRMRTPSQQVIDEVSSDARWAQSLAGVGLHGDSVQPLTWYIHRLHELRFSVDAWESTYIHVLTGQDPVLQWLKGTALRPLLAKLPTALADEFLEELAMRLASAYPSRDGITLFAMPRVFFVAKRH